MLSEDLTPTSAPTQLEVELRGAVRPGAELGCSPSRKAFSEPNSEGAHRSAGSGVPQKTICLKTACNPFCSFSCLKVETRSSPKALQPLLILAVEFLDMGWGCFPQGPPPPRVASVDPDSSIRTYRQAPFLGHRWAEVGRLPGPTGGIHVACLPCRCQDPACFLRNSESLGWYGSAGGPGPL